MWRKTGQARSDSEGKRMPSNAAERYLVAADRLTAINAKSCEPEGPQDLTRATLTCSRFKRAVCAIRGSRT
jgi:hypothetical protein